MLRVIVAPLMGGVIGYITNNLAIKMLFHPRKSVYIGKWHVPFTPGLIPAQKRRIAKSIGSMVSGKLLDGDTIRGEALSGQTIEKLRAGVAGWLKENAGQTTTVRALLERMVSAEEVEDYAERLSSGVSHTAVEELEKRNAGKLVTHMMLKTLREKMQGMFFMAMLDDKTLSSLEEPVANAVNAAIRTHGPDILKTEISKLEQELLDSRICDLTAKYTDRIDDLVDMLTQLYRALLVNHLDALLHAANVGAIVEKKVNSFSSAELEALIFGLMKRELNAIVYLGALLGFFMGFINLLF